MPTKMAIQTKPLIKKNKNPATPIRLSHVFEESFMYFVNI